MDAFAVQGVFDDAIANFGIDYDGPVAVIQTNNNISVPEVQINIPEVLVAELLNFDPLVDDGNFDIDLYVNMRHQLL